MQIAPQTARVGDVTHAGRVTTNIVTTPYAVAGAGVRSPVQPDAPFAWWLLPRPGGEDDHRIGRAVKRRFPGRWLPPRNSAAERLRSIRAWRASPDPRRRPPDFRHAHRGGDDGHMSEGARRRARVRAAAAADDAVLRATTPTQLHVRSSRRRRHLRNACAVVCGGRPSARLISRRRRNRVSERLPSRCRVRSRDPEQCLHDRSRKWSSWRREASLILFRAPRARPQEER